MALLCAAHHRAVHAGFLLIEGRVSSGLTFFHADGSRYGAPASAQSAVAFTEAFQALRTLGFRESETRAALAAARTHVGANPSTEEVLRRALAATRKAAA